MKFLSTISLLFLCISLFAQTNDCDMAQVVCSDETIILNPQGPGDDDFLNPNNDQGCLVSGEINSSWFYLEFDEAMPPNQEFGFTISPMGGAGEDYDWALYGPDVGCNDLGSTTRCSSSSGACGFCPETGMGMGTTDVTEGPGTGDGFVSTIIVQPGQGFYLIIDNWLGSNNGFLLKWEGDAAPWLNCDATPPCAHVADAGPDQVHCVGQSPYQLNGDSDGTSGMETYAWSGDGAQYLNNVNIPSPSANIPDNVLGVVEFILTVTENDCVDIDTMTITINALPVLEIDPAGPFCPEDPNYVMTSNPTGGTWGGAAPFGNFNPMNNGPGIHTVTYQYTDGNNCMNSVEELVEVYESPEVNITPDPAEYCEEEEFLVLFAVGTNGGGNYDYDWDGPSGSGNGQTFIATAPGFYFITITDGNGCLNTSSKEVVENPTPFVDINEPGAICESTEVYTMSGIPSGGDWSGSIITPDGIIFPQNVDPGLYPISYSYTDVEGCTGLDEIVIEIVESPIATATNGGPYCEGNSIELLGDDGGNGGASYSWTGPNGYTSSEQNPSDAVDSGYYYLQVTLGDCVSLVDSTEVVISAGLTPDSDASNNGPYCAGETIELIGQTSSSGSSIVYQWTGPDGYVSSDQNPTDATESGIYTLVVIIDDCPSEASDTEVIYTNAIDAEATNNGPYCVGENIELIGSTTSSGTTISYQWTGPGGYTSSEQNPTDITQGGDYNLLITIDGCNSELVSTDLIINPLPTPNINGLTSACEGEMISLDAGDQYMEYEWSDGSDLQTLEVSSSNTYGVTVTDEFGCTGEDMIDIEIFINPTPNITGSSSYCVGSSTNLALDNTFSQYLWSDNSTDPNLVVSNPGIVSVTVTDGNNCTGVATIDITESTSLEPIINGDFSFCPGGSTDLDAGSGFTIYNWSDGSDGQSISVNTPGDYSVTVGDGGGCTGETIVSVTLFTPPTVMITGQQNICENENSMLDAGPGYSMYNWSDGSGNQLFEATNAGIYSVTITDMNGCTNEDQFEVFINNNPEPMIQGNTNICVGEPTDLDAGAGYSQYSWSTGSGQQMLNTNMPGIYSVTVTDANGCTGENQIEVFENPSPDAQISGVLEFCSGESVTLTGSGGISYSWTGGSTTPTLVVNSSGTIDLIVTDANGCTNASSVMVIEIQNPEPEIEGLTTLCIGNSIFINTMDSYDQYNWSTGSNQSSIEVFSGGTYRVTVTDGNGCTGETEIDIEEVESLSPQINGVLGFCFGGSTTLEADPGYETYSWSTGQNSQNITVDASGNYTVTVSDADGCTGESVITVEEFPEIVLDLGNDQIIQLGESTTVLATVNVDPDDIEMVEWSPSEAVECLDPKCIEVSVTSNVLITLQATVSVMGGCIDTDDVTIRVEKDQRVYFPSAFSPNEDGINDVFIISAKEGRISNISQFLVYDRWGETVHEAYNIQPNNELDGWTGYFNNEALNPGVYVYYAEIDFADGDTVLFMGDISIVK